MSLNGILNWAPFHLDALGLVTLLGAEDINRAVGRLARSRYTEFLPFLSAFVIAGDQIIEEEFGVSLYNLTDYIHTTDVKGWLTRWLRAQRFKTTSRTVIHVDILNAPKSTIHRDLQALTIGSILMLGVLVFSLLIRDWYGFATSIGMLVSVVVRRIVIQDLRDNLDEAALESVTTFRGAEPVKLFITMPNGKLVSVHTRRGIVTGCFTRTKPLQHALRNRVAKICGWIAFGVQIVSLGMCSLVIQLYTIALLIGGSAMLLGGFGADESILGHHVSLTVHVPDRPDRRLCAYSDMQLQLTEEEFLIRMGMMPQRENNLFWQDYEKAKAIAVVPAQGRH
jgi:hypothetical protein